jgi:hypothetical protein
MLTKKENHLKLIPQNNGLCYNETHNYLTTRISKSCTGNTYLSCLKLSDKVSIVFKLGIGDSKVFLNCITVSFYPNGKRRIIGIQLYNNFEYSEAEIELCTKQLISKEIVDALNKNSVHCDQAWVNEQTNKLVWETMQNQKKAYNIVKILF